MSEEAMVDVDDNDGNQCDHKGIASDRATWTFLDFHCRFVLDGGRCSHAACPFSHSKLKCALYEPYIELFLTLFIDTDDPGTVYHLAASYVAIFWVRVDLFRFLSSVDSQSREQWQLELEDDSE
jgi:hypothetical protein